MNDSRTEENVVEEEAIEDQVDSLTNIATNLLPTLYSLMIEVPAKYRERTLKALNLLIEGLP